MNQWDTMTLASQLSAALSGLQLTELYQSRGTLLGQVSQGGVCAAAEWTDWPVDFAIGNSPVPAQQQGTLMYFERKCCATLQLQSSLRTRICQQRRLFWQETQLCLIKKICTFVLFFYKENMYCLVFQSLRCGNRGTQSCRCQSFKSIVV